MTRLTQRERIFAHEYARTGKLRESALVAGYTPNSASVQATKALKRQRVLDEIDKVRAYLTQASCWDAKRLISRAGEIVDDPDAKPRDRVSAMELIAKLTGAYDQRISVDMRAQVTQHVQLSDSMRSAVESFGAEQEQGTGAEAVPAGAGLSGSVDQASGCGSAASQ